MKTKKNFVDSKLHKVIVYVLVFVGFGIVLYSVFTQSTPIMITGFSLVGVAMLLAIPMGFKEADDAKLKLKKDFNDIIELIKEDKLKDAFNKSEKDIYEISLKAYVQGLIFGRRFKGDDLDNIKFKIEK